MQLFKFKPLSSVWLKAAVIGSLWASFEIIAGSFLHNLHLPFSGTLLTAFSVFLLIAFFQFWDDRGALLRAGLICALMKSLSPSAVILGPMIGIFTEALIIWLMIILFGKNLFSYILGGALAVASALLHKVVSLLILYGFDLVKIFEGTYLWTVKQFRIEEAKPLRLVLAILVIYFILGSFAAILGYLVGRKTRDMTLQGFKPLEGALKSRNELFSLSRKQHYSLILLLSHLLVMVICLWLLNRGNYFLSLPICMVYIAGCFYWYRNSLRYLKKPGFWIQFLLITLIASFLLEGYSKGTFFSFDGLIIGLKMNLRAFVIMVGFTAISTELKNPLIRSLLYDRGLASLYQSLSLSFSALPEIIAQMPAVHTMMRQQKSFMNYLFTTSRSLLLRFEQEQSERPTIFIITGQVGEGKTSFLENLIRELKQHDIIVSGFTAPGIFLEGAKVGFMLRDLSSGETHHLASKIPGKGWIRYGHYYFNPQKIRVGNDLLLQSMQKKTDLLLIDEVGPLEMSNQGWAPAIETLCKESLMPQLWIVRKSLLMRASKKWNVGDVYVFNIDEDAIEELLEILMQNQSKKAGIVGNK